MAEDSEFNFQQRQEIFLFSIAYRLALGLPSSCPVGVNIIDVSVKHADHHFASLRHYFHILN
jgi:hypothetical protein